MVEWIKQSSVGDIKHPYTFTSNTYNTPVSQHGPPRVRLFRNIVWNRRSSGTYPSFRSLLRSAAGSSNQGPCYSKGVLDSLDFDALSYTSDELVDICVQLFNEFEIDTLGIDQESIHEFVLDVRNQMGVNPYHNWFHVADVVQTIYCLGLQSGLLQIISCKEKLSMLVAALCHDIDHPGVNTTFLIKTRSALASKYSMDPACLEQHHSVRASELMTNEFGTGLLDGLCAATIVDRSEIIARVHSLILATDMSRHADYCSRLASMVECWAAEGKTGAASLDESHWPLAAELLIKCADTSNVLKPFSIAKRWAIRITDEFFRQGDLERSLGMEVSAMCDRHLESRVGLQKGFVSYIAPFYQAMAVVLPGLAVMNDRLLQNQRMWEAYASDDALISEVLKEERSRRLG